MATIAQAKPVLQAYIAANIPAFLWGAPGVGKSDLVREIAREAGADLIDFRANLKAPEDMAGIPVPDMTARETIWLRPGGLPFVDSSFPTDRPIYLFMDELNTASPAMMAAAFGLVLDRRVADHILLSNVRIIAAGNRMEDKAAAQRMPSALVNRFAHLTVDADPAAFRDWCKANGLPPIVPGFTMFRPEMLHSVKHADATHGGAFPSPRAWAQVAKVCHLPDGLREPAITGIVGTHAATEFQAFHMIFNHAPRPDQIEADPDGAPVPADLGVRYAVALALSRYAKRTNIAALARYLARTGEEFQTVFFTDATARDSELCKTPAFIAWTENNRAVAI